MIVPKLEIPPLGTLPSQFVNGQLKMIGLWCEPTNNTQNEKHIELIIHESFKDLVRFQVLILHTSLIFPDALNCDSPFSFAEPTSCDRRVWKEDEHDDTPSSAKGSTKNAIRK